MRSDGVAFRGEWIEGFLTMDTKVKLFRAEYWETVDLWCNKNYLDQLTVKQIEELIAKENESSPS